ncbi:MAG TPA: site-specific integrase [Pelolinea sp.]|nr:site-specific integrase [Pelolinea sp.]
MDPEFSPSFHIDSHSSIPVVLRFWEIYLHDQGRSDFTIKAFRGDIRLLQRFLPPDFEISQITTIDLNRFIDWLKNGRGKGIPCSPKSLSRRVTSIKSFFRWLSSHGRIPFDPADALVQQTVISPLPEVLSAVEERKALEAARKFKDDSRPFVLLKLLLETGIKKSECLNIRKSHIFLEGDGNYLFVRYADLKDRNKERKIPVSTDWVEAYKNYLVKYEPEDQVFPWSPRRLEYILEDIGKAAHLDKHLSFSMCRWNAALKDVRDGKELNSIRQKLGISKIQWREIKTKLLKLSQPSE